MVKVSYATIYDNTGLIAYSDTIVDGVLDAAITMEFHNNEIYDSIEGWSKAMSIFNKFPKTKISMKEPILKGWDRKGRIVEYTLGAAVTSQTALATAVNVKLGENEKYNFSTRSTLRFNFTPTGTNYTNEVVVTDLHPACEDGSGGSGSAKGNYWITVQPVDATKYFGIANGTPVPATTNVSLSGNVNFDKSGVPSPLSSWEYPISNYLTYLKTTYEYGYKAEKYNLHDKTSLRYREDRFARQRHNQDKERQFLFGGDSVYVPVTSATQAATIAFSKMKGFLTNIKTGGSSAVVPFGGEVSFEEAHEATLYNLNQSGMDKKRLVFCDDAYLHYWTYKKLNAQNVRIEIDDKTYGIKGVTRIYTGYGDFVLDCVVQRDIADKSRAICQSADVALANPFAVFLNPAKIEIGELISDRLHTETQERNYSYHQAYYENCFSYLAHNIETENYGMIYNPAYWAL